MARTDTLPHFLTDVADAIRTKKGTNDTITASSFDTEITNLPSGSSGVPIWNWNDVLGADGYSTTLTVNVSNLMSGFPLNKITPKKGLVLMYTRSDYSVSNNVTVLAETDFLTATDGTRQKLIMGWCDDFSQDITLTQTNSARLAIGGLLLKHCEVPTSNDIILNTTSNNSNITVNPTDNMCVYFTTGAYSAYNSSNDIMTNQFYNNSYASPTRTAFFITKTSGAKVIPFDGNGSAIIGIELHSESTS